MRLRNIHSLAILAGSCDIALPLTHHQVTASLYRERGNEILKRHKRRESANENTWNENTSKKRSACRIEAEMGRWPPDGGGDVGAKTGEEEHYIDASKEYDPPTR